MKLLFAISFLLSAYFSFGQKSHTVRGSLVDTAGQVVDNSVVVLMTQSDSTQLKLDYFQTGAFELTWTDSLQREVMLYISAIGYNSRYIEVDRSQPDLGEIVMMPLSVYMDEVTVAAREPIGHKFERGRDEYTIPEWLGQRSYDVNSLLAMIPGLAMVGSEIEIAGAGKPTYLLNGLAPRMGELENISPKDIEKITIIRMPGAKFGQAVIGLINIETRKTWHDYFSVRLKDEFIYTNVVENTSSVSINFRKGKWSQFLSYSHNYLQLDNDVLYSYETVIPEEKVDYRRRSDIDIQENTNKHTILYSPKFQINDHSFVDLQYLLFTDNTSADNSIYTYSLDESEPNLLGRTLTDGDNKMQNIYIRYDNTFDSGGKKRLTFNTVYTRVNDERDERRKEESKRAGGPMDTTYTGFEQTYRNEALGYSLDYKFTLWDVLKMETGILYGTLWMKSGMDYYTAEHTNRSRTRSEHTTFYLNADHRLGELAYQIGLRGEYEDHSFYFLPSVGLSYRIKDDFNFMLYYRRTVNYPSARQLNTNESYVDKYLYFTGNSLLETAVFQSIMGRVALPFNLSLVCTFGHRKNDVLSVAREDEQDPKMVAVTYANVDKTRSLDLTLSWNRTFGFYYLNMNAAYSRYFVKSPFIDNDSKYKPIFSINASHSFFIGKYMQADIYMAYRTPYYHYNSYMKSTYALTAQLQFNLLKKRMNIKITGNNLLNEGNYYQKEKYKHTVFINEGDYHPRGLFIGITYNFNNFMDLFRKNEAGSEMIKRVD